MILPLHFEVDILKSLQIKKDSLYAKFYKEYKEDYHRELDNKHEYNTYINTKSEYEKICIDVARQEIITKYLEETVDNIKKMNFSVKNWIELKKYLEGM